MRRSNLIATTLMATLGVGLVSADKEQAKLILQRAGY